MLLKYLSDGTLVSLHPQGRKQEKPFISGAALTSSGGQPKYQETINAFSLCLKVDFTALVSL